MSRFASIPLLLLFATIASPNASPNATADEPFDEFDRTHWSLVARRRPAVPVESDASRVWARTPVDAFVLEKLRSAELSPAPPADRRTLARRLGFDLTGLPLAPEIVDEFCADPAPDAYERLVDRLLASPRHGEHAAQAWLDVVRFAETEGFEYDQHRPGAWRYRDYVIRAMNADKPFDQFAREQLAGDELPEPTEESRVAVGFHRLGPVRRNAGNGDVAFSRNEVLTEMTDAVGTVFLGLTVGCARCHDHKFDPIRQTDYYRLQAFLASSYEHDIQLGSADEIRVWRETTEKIRDEQKKIREMQQDATGEERDELVARFRELTRLLPPPLPTLSSVQRKADEKATVRLLIRGQTDKPGDPVGPRPLGVLLPDGAAEWSPELPYPKLRLADWLLAPDHPLTARVQANRLWAQHFGAGIVSSANDFGLNGANPTHPELLDWLANQLVDHQWQQKRLRRLLVTSEVYRQSSRSQQAATAHERDPANHLLWRYPRRRLTAEQIRDSLLWLSGRLVSKIGGDSVMVPVEQELIDLLYNPLQWVATSIPRENYRRSIYLIAKRNLRLPFMEAFDQPDLQISCSRRATSTHAPQALELLNGEFSNQMADALAARLEQEARHSGATTARELTRRMAERGFTLAAGRTPTDGERQLAMQFLEQHSTREFALALVNLNAFLYVD